MGYIDTTSMPDAMTPAPTAWLPFITTSGSLLCIDGTVIR